MKARYCIEHVVPGVELGAFRAGSVSLIRHLAEDAAELVADRANRALDLSGDVLIRVELRPADGHSPLLDRIEAACGLPDPAEACRTVLALCREARS